MNYMMNEKEIGGFFQLEENAANEFHQNALKLNSGRNALKYILISKKPNKVYIPYYICDSVIEVIEQLEINYDFYFINKNFFPVFNKELSVGELFLYVNYFGINDHNVYELSKTLSNHLIIDNTQSFFSFPQAGIDAFYSPRKFVGVADGGYLYTNTLLNFSYETDVSYEKYTHILKRTDINAHESYNCFQENEERFKKQAIKKMSKLTKTILKNIDYERIQRIRKENFEYLHQSLNEFNQLPISYEKKQTPMIYPLLIYNDQLRQILLNNKIFVATYWKEVLARVDARSTEHDFSRFLIPLPIDQRYGKNEMDIMLKIIGRVLT